MSVVSAQDDLQQWIVWVAQLHVVMRHRSRRFSLERGRDPLHQCGIAFYLVQGRERRRFGKFRIRHRFFLLQDATRGGSRHSLKLLRHHNRKARQFDYSEEWSLVPSLTLDDSPGAIRSRQVAHAEAVLAQDARGDVGALAALAIRDDFAVVRQLTQALAQFIQGNVDRTGNEPSRAFVGTADIQQQRGAGIERRPLRSTARAPRHRRARFARPCPARLTGSLADPYGGA